jgi:hypothetical protein
LPRDDILYERLMGFGQLFKILLFAGLCAFDGPISAAAIAALDIAGEAFALVEIPVDDELSVGGTTEAFASAASRPAILARHLSPS